MNAWVALPALFHLKCTFTTCTSCTTRWSPRRMDVPRGNSHHLHSRQGIVDPDQMEFKGNVATRETAHKQEEDSKLLL